MSPPVSAYFQCSVHMSTIPQKLQYDLLQNWSHTHSLLGQYCALWYLQSIDMLPLYWMFIQWILDLHSSIITIFGGKKTCEMTVKTERIHCVCVGLQSGCSVGQGSDLDAHQSFAIFIQLSKGLLSSPLSLKWQQWPQGAKYLCVHTDRDSVSVTMVSSWEHQDPEQPMRG